MLTREILFLPLEHKIHIFSQPYNPLFFGGGGGGGTRKSYFVTPGVAPTVQDLDLFKLFIKLDKCKKERLSPN